MTIRNLESLFSPKSIGVVGPDRIGARAIGVLIDHLSAGGTKAPLSLIGLDVVREGIPSHASVEAIDAAPDLAICVAGPDEAPALVSALGAKGTRGVVFLSQGYQAWPAEALTATLRAARPHTIRVLGPGSLGLIAPHVGLNASLAREAPTKGEVAVISRSAGFINATLSWAREHHVGLSAVVSLGQKADIDIGDLLDWFAGDYRTRAVLVHLETISTPQKFMSAARACARSKPVIVMRPGASRDQKGVGVTHSGRLATIDAVYDAAFQRAGFVRVDAVDDLFDAVETVSKVKPGAARHLAILANGRSLATIAVDKLESLKGSVARLSAETSEALKGFVRAGTALEIPLVLDDDAPPETIAKVVELLAQDVGVDAVLAIHAPTAFVSSEEAAEAIAGAARAHQKRLGRKRAILAAILDERAAPREMLEAAGVPCHATPEEAVKSFRFLTRYSEAQESLMAIPQSLPADFTPDPVKGRAIVQAALDMGRAWLSPRDVRDLLEAYDIPVAPMLHAETGVEAAEKARHLFATHERVVVKVASPDLPFKSDTGGVVLDLKTPRQVQEAADGMIGRIRETYPDKTIEGVIVMPMIDRKGAIELICGLADDPVFGPVIVFGRGGRAVEVIVDRALDLVPLDMNLARRLIDRTAVKKLLAGYRSTPPADLTAIALTLVKLSQLATDIPEVREIDLNPIIADHQGVIALDSRVRIAPVPEVAGKFGHPRLAIRPYPKEWERVLPLKGGTSVLVRPVKPEDEPAFAAFFKHISAEDLRLRFFAPIKDFSHAFLAKLTQLDYARAMALGAFDPATGDLLGVVRLHADPDHKTGEYAILVRSNLKGVGLGWKLMQLIIEWAKADGIEIVKGEVLRENRTMLKVCEALGFSVRTSHEDEAIMDVTLRVADVLEHGQAIADDHDDDHDQGDRSAAQ